MKRKPEHALETSRGIIKRILCPERGTTAKLEYTDGR